jgi:DNA-binding SARP family transcriptional activator/tetratricopeptide (TPR) repeat protein/DNA-binding XRE family transcriptional regulator
MESRETSFGEQLRARRVREGMTQQELAAQAGVSLRTLRSIERGQVTSPHRRSRALLAAAVGLPLTCGYAEEVDPRIRVLGPLTIQDGSADVRVDAPKIRLLLGLLAIQPNRGVGRDEIVDVLWDSRPPNTYMAVLHNFVSRLRGLLEPSGGRERRGLAIVTTGTGYQLRVRSNQLDLLRFVELIDEAERAGHRDAQADLLERAVRQWRGPVLADLPEAIQQHPVAVDVTRRRLDAVLSCADLGLARDDHTLVVEIVEPLFHEEPLHEGLVARLMLGLAGSSRQAAALTHYARIRERLRDELGVEPGAELRDAYLRVLRQEMVCHRAAPGGVAISDNALPRDIPDFTGRAAELRRLTGQDGVETATALVHTIDGMAGIGKTTLAVHAAHALASRYPDAQIFVDLNAHCPDRAPMEPHVALDRLLRGLGVPGDRIPEDLDGRAELWRRVTADHKLLAVLDNASTAEQVRPLLPTGRHCMAIVTSRARMADIGGSQTLSLDVMPSPVACLFFERVGWRERNVGQSQAIEELVRLCGAHPLAIRIAAARLRNRPAWRVADLVERLRDERRGLDEFDTGDLSVGATFALSYRDLPARHRRLFRLLGLFPGEEIDTHAAAALADLDLREVDRLLENLVDVHLLYEPSVGSYRFHDLIRRHARDVALAEESATERAAALRRLINYYLHAANAAANAVLPSRIRFDLAAAPSSAELPPFESRSDAITWLERQRVNLVSMIETAAGREWHEHTWRLAQALWRFFFERGYLNDWLSTHELALTAVRALDDPAAEAETLKNLGVAYLRAGRSADGIDCQHRALALDRARHDPAGEAKTWNNLGFFHDRDGAYEEALRCHRMAEKCYRELGDLAGESCALVGISNAYRELGDLENAFASTERALRLAKQAGDRWSESLALSCQALVYRGWRNYPQAQANLVAARDIAVALGDPGNESVARIGLGLIRADVGSRAEAVAHLREGLRLAELGGELWGVSLARQAFQELGVEIQ